MPTNDAFTILTIYLGGLSGAGGKMKSTGNLWNQISIGTTNESGFTALPSGFRNYYDGTYMWMGGKASFWVVTSDFFVNSELFVYWELLGIISDAFSGLTNKNNGFSVRCLKD